MKCRQKAAQNDKPLAGTKMKTNYSYEGTDPQKYKSNIKNMSLRNLYIGVFKVKSLNLPDEEKENVENKMSIGLQERVQEVTKDFFKVFFIDASIYSWCPCVQSPIF